MKEIKFNDFPCRLEFPKYLNNKRQAIMLIDKNYNETVAIATVNLPEVPLAEDEIIIKNYSENEGIEEVLFNAEIISSPIGYVNTGFVRCSIVKLLYKE